MDIPYFIVIWENNVGYFFIFAQESKKMLHSLLRNTNI